MRQQLEDFRIKEVENREGLGDEEIERKMDKIRRRQERKREKTPSQLLPKGDSGYQSSTEGTKSQNNLLAPNGSGEAAYVRLKGQTSVGRLLSVDGKNATVLFGQMKTTVKVDRLVPAQEPQKQESPTGATFVSRDT